MGTNLLLCVVDDDGHFSLDCIERAFNADERFLNIQREGIGQSVIEAEFVDGNDQTTARVRAALNVISLSRAGDAALTVALILRKCCAGAVRLIDTNYSFDIEMKDFATLDELRAAVELGQEDSG